MSPIPFFQVKAAFCGMVFALAFSGAHAGQNSITDKGSVAERKSVSENNSVKKEKIEIRNLKGGKLVKSGSRVILQGGTIIGKAGDKEPLIQIENPQNKQILIRDTRIITDGITQARNEDNAGIVVIENGNKQGAKSRIKVENVHVTSRNSNIQATAVAANGGSACAGLVCTSLDDDDESNITVNAKGRNQFKAVAK